MNYRLWIILTSLLTILACKKTENSEDDCTPGVTIERIITDKPATVTLSGSQYYIIEQNTIDTRLKPCNLAPAFQINNLSVMVSGEVKFTSAGTPGPGPCCSQNFIITKISR